MTAVPAAPLPGRPAPAARRFRVPALRPRWAELPVAVVALGGNALQHRGEAPGAETQLRRVADAVRAIAPLARTHRLVLCHGNGPQVGLLANESAEDPVLARPFPLDVLGAETQGSIGYMIALELSDPARRYAGAVCVVTTTLVDAHDPAFDAPSKPIGEVYDKETAQALAARHGWSVARDGAGWRRVVPSPAPVAICEIAAITTLLDAGFLVVCAGGGGVPVVQDEGRRRGVEAVVDKDLAAAALGVALAADLFLILTDVDGVRRDFGTPRARTIAEMTVDEAESLDLAPGSMGPKVDAARRFVGATGRPAVIGALADAPSVIAGRSGTTITPTVPRSS